MVAQGDASGKSPEPSLAAAFGHHRSRMSVQWMRREFITMNGSSLGGLSHQRGFSLFEVLITVTVISIGLLGLAGLQFVGLRAVNASQDHTSAALLAQDIAERIQAHPDGAYDGIDLDSSTSVGSEACDDSHDCDSAQLVKYDKYQWQQMINQPLLANLQIKIVSHGSSPNDYYTITLIWGNSDNQQILTTSLTR